MRSSDILRRWDKGSRQQRIAILSSFIQTHRNSTGAEIERVLGANAMLLFTRITAWLRLTYMLGYELSVQLTAVSLFLQGQRFLTNFMEVGGIQMLLDVMCHRTKTALDKQNALLILIHVANSGRVYREMVCDEVGFPEDRVRWAESVVGIARTNPALRNNSDELKNLIHKKLATHSQQLRAEGQHAQADTLDRDVAKAADILTGCVPYSGVDMLVESLVSENDGQTLELFGSLFMALGHGNPRKRSLIDTGLLRVLRVGCEKAALCAASTLRSLQVSKQHYQGGASFALITSRSDVQKEEKGQVVPLPQIGQEQADQANKETARKAHQSEVEEQEARELLDTLASLLVKDNVKLRFEGTELLVTAAQNDRLLMPVLQKMISNLEDPDDKPADALSTEARHPNRARASAARVLGKILQWRQERDGVTEAMVELFKKRRVYLLLLQSVKSCDTKDIDQQRECMTALQAIVRDETHFAEENALLQQVFGAGTLSGLVAAESFSVEELRSLKTVIQASSEYF